ncbi:MAG: hypothetical protein GY730_06865 [bacterium]|nr:hypothetical protein [bacterium]
MRKIILLLFVIISFSNGVLAMESDRTISNTHLLESIYKIDVVTRRWESQQLMIIGGVMGLGGMNLENDSLRSATTGAGFASFLAGLGMRFFYKTPLESKYAEYVQSSDYDLTAFIEDIRNDERNTRLIMAGILALPLLMNFTTNRAISDADFNLYWKSFFAGASLMYLFNQTPTEQLCNEMLSGRENNLSFQITPAFNSINAKLCYRF